MHKHRSAYTLIELLVVVVILVTLIAITLPLAKKVLEDSYTREASRQLNGWLAMAKINAVRTGRPWGLYMQCDLPLGVQTTSPLRQITKVYLAEVQPPYAGSTIGARAEIYLTNTMNQTRELLPIILDANGNSQADTQVELKYWQALIFPGEPILVRFDFKGEWYRCIRGAATNPAPYTDPNKFYYLGTLNGLGYPWPPGYGTSVPNYAIARQYQILRGPRRVGNPLELTGGTCIDLAYCGVGPAGSGFPPDSGTVPANVQALTVMFTAAGGVEGIYVNNSPSTPQGTVHLLVGKVQKVYPPLGTTPADPQYGMNMFDPENSNLADPTSLWVSISRSTGTVTTSENLPPSLGTGSMAPNLTYQYYNPTTSMNQTVTLNPGTAADRTTYLGLCRQIAIGRKQMGGR